MNILTASVATALTVKLFGSFGIGLAIGAVTLLILIFGEITPKTLAYKHNELIARESAVILYILEFIFYPISWVLVRFNYLIIKVFKAKEAKIVTEEEIRSLARLGVETGAIDYPEREMIENVFHFDEKEVKNILIPRHKTICLNGNVPVQ